MLSMPNSASECALRVEINLAKSREYGDEMCDVENSYLSKTMTTE